MGGKSGKPTIGYWYDMDVLATACLAADEVVEFVFADRTAWIGSVTESGTISIYKDDLFGGAEREGGVFGQVDIMLGDADLPVNEFLGSSMRKTGILGPVPAYRNSVNFFFRGVIGVDSEFAPSGVFDAEGAPPPLDMTPSFTSKLKSQPKAFRWSAMNPYFKPFKVKLRRYTKDWHPEIAKISTSTLTSVIPSTTNWDYCQFPHSVAVGAVHPELKTPPPVGGGGYTWFNGTAPIGWNSSGTYPSQLPAHGNVASWIIKTITVPPESPNVTFSGVAENSGFLYIDGVYVYSNNPTNYQPSVAPPFLYSTKLTPGMHTIAVFLTNELGSGSSSTDIIDFRTSITFSNDSADMNPAHIIRECLTDLTWGLGWPTSDIDDASFLAAAQTLFDEGFGLSLKWSEKTSIEDFIMMVERHINSVVYQDRSSGKLKLKLIRNDYVVGDLIQLDPSNSNLESISRAANGDIVNEINLTYLMSNNATDTITLHDLASIQTQGQVISQDVEMLGIRNATLAARVAQRELDSRVKPIAKIVITTNRIGFNLYEGGVFKLSWPDQGISSMVCRVVTIDLGTLTDNAIRIEAVQDVFGLPTTSYIKPTTSNWVDPNSAPVASPLRFITETPYYTIARSLSDSDLAYLDATDCYIDVYSVEPSGDALDFNLWSAVGSSELTNKATGTHVPEVTLTAIAAKEETSVLHVSNARELVYLIESDSACVIIEGEYAKVTDYDTDANTITVNRAVLDTTLATHAIGTKVILSDFNAAQDEISYLPTEVVSVKVQTRTARGILPIAMAPIDTYTIQQRQARPYPPGKVRVNGSAYPTTIGSTDGLSLTWAHRNRLTQTADMVTQSASTITPEVGTTYNVRIYGTTSSLLRSVTALTTEAYDYTTLMEESDMGGLGGGLAIDQYWDKTVLLANMNGANASVVFPDISPNFAIPNGNVHVTTSQLLFGSAVATFDGTGDYLNLPYVTNYDLGSANCTIEFWFRPASVSVPQVIFDWRSANDGTGIIIYQSTVNPAKLTVSVGDSTTPASFTFNITSSSNLVIGTLYHTRLVKNGSNWQLYLNGATQGSATSSVVPYLNSAAIFFGIARNIATGFNGQAADLRITKAARNTSGFAAPTQRLDQFIKPDGFSDYGLLVTFEKAKGDELSENLSSGEWVKNYADIPPYWSLTSYGEVGDYGHTTVDNADSKFGTKCGQGLYLHDRFEFGLANLTGSITFDAWVKIPSSLTPTGFVFQIFAFDGLWQLGIQSLTHHWFDASTGGIFGGGVSHPVIAETPLFDQWVHYAITMTQTEVGSDYETEIKLYKNGILFLTTTTETATASACRAYPVRISNHFKCDEVRIRQGLHYTGDFSPPTLSSYPQDPYWADTVVLMPMSGANNSTKFENIAEITKLLTPSGNAQVSTAQSKFGGSSAVFDGTGDYLSSSDIAKKNLGSSNFTIEAWLRPTANLKSYAGSVYASIISCDTDGSRGWGVALGGTISAITSLSFTGFSNNSTSIAVTVSHTFALNTWYHIRVVRDGNLVYIFVDGVLKNIGGTAFTLTIQISSSTLKVGAAMFNATYLGEFTGYIEDLRMTLASRGVADFTPPSLEFGKYVPALNTQLTFELESQRDGLVSWQKHRHTVTRT